MSVYGRRLISVALSVSCTLLYLCPGLLILLFVTVNPQGHLLLSFVNTQSTYLPTTEGGRYGGTEGRSLHSHSILKNPRPSSSSSSDSGKHNKPLLLQFISSEGGPKKQLGSLGGGDCIVAGTLPPSGTRFQNISRCADGSPRRLRRAFDSFFFLYATLFQPILGI